MGRKHKAKGNNLPAGRKLFTRGEKTTYPSKRHRSERVPEGGGSPMSDDPRWRAFDGAPGLPRLDPMDDGSPSPGRKGGPRWRVSDWGPRPTRTVCRRDPLFLLSGRASSGWSGRPPARWQRILVQGLGGVYHGAVLALCRRAADAATHPDIIRLSLIIALSLSVSLLCLSHSPLKSFRFCPVSLSFSSKHAKTVSCPSVRPLPLSVCFFLSTQ